MEHAADADAVRIVNFNQSITNLRLLWHLLGVCHPWHRASQRGPLRVDGPLRVGMRQGLPKVPNLLTDWDSPPPTPPRRHDRHSPARPLQQRQQPGLKSKSLSAELQLLILQEENDDLQRLHTELQREHAALKASRNAEKENMDTILAKRWLHDEGMLGASEELQEKNKELQDQVFHTLCVHQFFPMCQPAHFLQYQNDQAPTSAELGCSDSSY